MFGVVEPAAEPNEKSERNGLLSRQKSQKRSFRLVALAGDRYPWLRSTAVVARSSTDESSALSLVACWAFAIACMSLNAAGTTYIP